jgi:hypothetical protein
MMRAKDLGAKENGVKTCAAQNYSFTHPKTTLRRKHF